MSGAFEGPSNAVLIFLHLPIAPPTDAAKNRETFVALPVVPESSIKLSVPIMIDPFAEAPFQILTISEDGTQSVSRYFDQNRALDFECRARLSIGRPCPLPGKGIVSLSRLRWDEA